MSYLNRNPPSPFAFDDFPSYFSALARTSDANASHRTRDTKWANWLGYGSRRTVGMVREGRRTPSRDFLIRLGRFLGQSEAEQIFLELLSRSRNSSTMEQLKALRSQYAARDLLTEEQLNYVAHWYSIAIKQLIATSGFDPKPESISRRLRGKVSPEAAQRSLENMVKVGILEKTESGYQVCKEKLTTPADIPIAALRQHHFEQICQAQSALRELPVQEREFLSVTLTFDPKRMQEAKGYLRKMAEEFDKRFSVGNPQEVFQLGMQFFPHSVGGTRYEN